MKIDLRIGNSTQRVVVKDENVLDVLIPRAMPSSATEEEEVRLAMQYPIGALPLRHIVEPGEKIVIITSDITRPMPTWRVMPILLEELYSAGVSPEDITILFALGSHRKHTEEEQRELVGEKVYGEIQCMDADSSDCIRLGYTGKGTPVDIARVVAMADRRICLGNIEYHYFAGYSGGAKAIMPGVSTKEGIQFNHSMMVEEKAHAGNLDTNPLRQDLEEAAQLCGVDFILNVVLDEHKRIVKAVAGDVKKAHREGCRFLDRFYKKTIQKRADIVIVSQGGAPKDLNLYQTQKALDNAKHAVRRGGIIILIGSCREGLGERTFEEWMMEADEPADLIKRIKKEFKLGGHKAAAIAMVLNHADVYLVSDLDKELVAKIFLKPYATVQNALNAAMEKLGEHASVIVMPYGGCVLPLEEMQ